MNILLVGAGQSPHLHGWAAYFVAAGYHVHLLTWQQRAVPGSAAEPGVTVHYLPGGQFLSRRGLGLARSVWAGWVIRLLMRRQRIDVLHAHQVIPYGYWAARSRQHPLVVTAWGSDVLTEPYASARAMRYVRTALARADLITADSDHLRRAAVALGAVAPSYVIPVGVDTTQLRPGGRAAARSRLGIDPTTPLVLSPRALSPVYNIDTIIDSIPLVQQAVPDVYYIIKFGYSAGREAELRGRAAERGVAAAVTFVGYTPAAGMGDYYAAADVCVSVASSDSAPKSVLEAMACGTPVVTSDLPWVHEGITDGVQALLVPARDAPALAAATIRLLRDPALCTRLSHEGRQYILAHADYVTAMARMDGLYHYLVREPQG